MSSVELNSIHMDAGRKPSEVLNRLLDYYFDVETLAGPPESLDKNIVRACTGNLLLFIHRFGVFGAKNVLLKI